MNGSPDAVDILRRFVTGDILLVGAFRYTAGTVELCFYDDSSGFRGVTVAGPDGYTEPITDSECMVTMTWNDKIYESHDFGLLAERCTNLDADTLRLILGQVEV